MARTFYPRKSILVPASAPHPKGTEYKDSGAYRGNVSENQNKYEQMIAIVKEAAKIMWRAS